MEQITLAAVKDCGTIYCDGKTVLLLGKKLWVFRTDGSFVCKLNEVQNPYKAIFLPGNMALIDSMRSRAYYYVSLDTGGIVWRSPKTGKRQQEEERFVSTPDGSIVFDYYYDLKGVFHVDRIEPCRQHHRVYAVKHALRTSCGCYCDDRGMLHVMQRHLLENDDPRYSDDKSFLYGILRLEFDGDILTSAWENQWTDAPLPRPYGCDDRYTLYGNLTVLDRKTGEWIDLLENDHRPNPTPTSAVTWRYDPGNDYLTVSWLGTLITTVVDCKARKRIAQYERECPWVGSMGCLIIERFWTGTTSGVIQLPFPHYDEG